MVIFKSPTLSKPAFSDLLFYSGYAIYLFFSIIKITFFYNYVPGALFKLLMLLTAALMFSSELFQKRVTMKETAAMIVTFLVTALAAMRIIGKIELLPLFITLFCARNKPVDKLLKVTSVIGITTLMTVVVSSKVGIINDYTTRGFNTFGVRVRHYLGFRYALYPSAVLYNFMSIDLYLNKYDKHIRKRCLIWLIVSLWFFRQTAARLSFYFSLLVLLIAFFYPMIYSLCEKFRKLSFCVCSSFILCSAVSFYVAINYTNKNDLMRNLNTVLEDRMSLAQDAFYKYGVKLFGTKVAFVGNGLGADGKKMQGIYNYVDCFYLNIFVKYGVIFLALVLLGYTVASLFSYKNKDYFMLIILATLAVHGLIDDLILYISYNSLWLIIPISLYSFYSNRVKLENILKHKLAQIRRTKKVRLRS